MHGPNGTGNKATPTHLERSRYAGVTANTLDDSEPDRRREGYDPSDLVVVDVDFAVLLLD